MSIGAFLNNAKKLRRDLSDTFWKAWGCHTHRRGKIRVPSDFEGIVDTIRDTPFSLVPAL
jgi:hypothetical protein